MKDIREIKPRYASPEELPFVPYKRDEETLARSWAIPGVPGLQHRIGGLEKNTKGNVSYLPDNHEKMVRIRAEKVERVSNEVPDLLVQGSDSGDLLIVGWGGSYGFIVTAFRELIAEGHNVSFVNFNYINPLPRNVKDVFSRFRKIVVCELNLGQFADYLRMKHQEFTYHQINKVQGVPFTISDIKDKCIKLLEEK